MESIEIAVSENSIKHRADYMDLIIDFARPHEKLTKYSSQTCNLGLWRTSVLRSPSGMGL